MAKTVGSATVPVNTGVSQASSMFSDLFETIDAGFDRYVKFDQYAVNKKTVSALQQQSQALTDLAQSHISDGTSSATGGNSNMMMLAAMGAIAVMGVFLLSKA